MAKQNPYLPTTDPLTGEQIAEILAANSGHLSRKIVVVVNNKVPYEAAFLIMEDIDGDAIKEMLEKNYGPNAVYYLLDLYSAGYKEVTEKKFVLNKGS